MSSVKFLATTVGRGARAVAGGVLIVVGLVLGGGWLALSVVGLIPLLASAFNVCLLAPLLGQPFKGQ